MIKRFFMLAPIVILINFMLNVIMPILIVAFVFGAVFGIAKQTQYEVSDNPCGSKINMLKVFITFQPGCDAGEWLMKESE